MMIKPKSKTERRAMLDEADIGSGEKTPAQHETDEMIRQIPPLPPSGGPAGGGGRTDKPGEPAASAPPRR
jgi:hypothetical protein